MPASSLADVVDSLLGKGTVLLGETSISLAGVDLVYLQVQLMLSSTANLVHGAPTPSTGVPELGWSASPHHPLDDQPSGPPPYQGEAREGSLSGPPPYEGGVRGGSGPRSAEAPTAAGGFVLDDIDDQTRRSLPDASPADESPEKGLARLALTVIELLRQTVERQAMRRVEAGNLPDDDVERMGVALIELEEKMGQLRELFGLTEEETNVDLGPIGKVL